MSVAWQREYGATNRASKGTMPQTGAGTCGQEREKRTWLLGASWGLLGALGKKWPWGTQ